MFIRVATDEHLLLMNGDILTNVDLRAFITYGERQDWDLLVGYTYHRYRCPFGVLNLQDGLVQGVIEKPSQEFAISAGIYDLRGSALRFVPDNEFFTMPEFMQKLIEAGKIVGGYHLTGSWL